MFALFRYFNLLKAEAIFETVTSQVIFAFFIGLFLAGLLLRTGNIIVVAIYHALFNFTFGARIFKQADRLDPTKTDLGFGSVVFSLIIYAVIGLSGVWMGSMTDKEQLNSKLGELPGQLSIKTGPFEEERMSEYICAT